MKIGMFARVGLPILVGIAIYVVFEYVRLEALYPIRNYVPDMLWAFAFTGLMAQIWGKKRQRGRTLWLLSPIVIGVLFEYSQLLLDFGTFDYFDMVAYALGWFLAMLVPQRAKDQKPLDMP